MQNMVQNTAEINHKIPHPAAGLGDQIRALVANGYHVVVDAGLLSPEESGALSETGADELDIPRATFHEGNIDTVNAWLERYPQAKIERTIRPAVDLWSVKDDPVKFEAGLRDLIARGATVMGWSHSKTDAGDNVIPFTRFTKANVADIGPYLRANPDATIRVRGSTASLGAGDCEPDPQAEPGPYAQIGPRLRDLGYSCIPTAPGTKQPGEWSDEVDCWVGLDNWRALYTSRLPDNEEMARWSDSAAGIGAGLRRTE
jgi:hypothetical protein